jgi:hypothetical protein
VLLYSTWGLPHRGRSTRQRGAAARGCFRFHVTGDRRKWAPAGGSSAAARSAARSMIFRPQTDELELAYVCTYIRTCAYDREAGALTHEKVRGNDREREREREKG